MIDASEYFLYLQEQQVLICQSCQYCLQPNGVKKHLQRKHSADVRKKLMSYAECLILRDPSKVVVPVTFVSAFECLKVTQGFCCSICNSLCGTIKEHCKAHRWTKVRLTFNSSNVLDRPWWKSQTIQTFFHGTDVKYFAVIDNNPPPSHSDKMNLLNQMLESAKLKDKELRSERDIVKEDKGKTENSPWLGRMDWKRMFLGRDMKRLVMFVERS